jgi:hypothetical protein
MKFSLALLACMIVFSVNTFAMQPSNRITLKVAGSGAAGAGTALAGATTWLAGEVVGGPILVIGESVSVVLAASAGYLVGNIIVDVDRTYFKGSLVSATGDFLGPINRRIYNMTHDDVLPEIIETADGQFRVVSHK